jgi:hypothetical protein
VEEELSDRLRRSSRSSPMAPTTWPFFSRLRLDHAVTWLRRVCATASRRTAAGVPGMRPTSFAFPGFLFSLVEIRFARVEACPAWLIMGCFRNFGLVFSGGMTTVPKIKSARRWQSGPSCDDDGLPAPVAERERLVKLLTVHSANGRNGTVGSLVRTAVAHAALRIMGR